MNSSNYHKMMRKAYRFTVEMGLNTSDIYESTMNMDIMDLSFAIWYEFYNNRQYTIEDFAFACFSKSIEVMNFMKSTLKLQPILATGNLSINGLTLFTESPLEISNRLRQNIVYDSSKFHTWLTIDDYIIDISLGANDWVLQSKTNPAVKRIDMERPIIIHTCDASTNIEYQPVFLGQDYFSKVRFN